MAALTLSPEYADREPEPALLVPPDESGMFHRRNVLDRANPVRPRWRIGWRNLPALLLEDIRTLWSETLGGALTFDWTPPGGAPGRARFLDDDLVWDQSGPGTVALELSLEEAR